MPKKIGVVLSGCGFKDGGEIHESVLTLLHIHKNGGEALCFAPDKKQARVVNHLTGDVTGETRNVLVEAARIARGNIRDIKDARATDMDALILPGGFGAVTNLCDFAEKGENCSVDPNVARLIREVRAAKKPIGAICIAPALMAKVLGEENPELTIGNDKGVAAKLQALGAKHIDCAVTEFHMDPERKIATTPAYMLGKTIADIDAGISKLVNAVLKMA